jgi:hypothetical protein
MPMKATPDVNDTLREQGLDAVRARNDRARKFGGNGENGSVAKDNDWQFYTGETSPPPRWLIKSILPESGVGLIAGQWGTFKTTTALELCLCVMTDLPFAGRYRVKRRGAALYIALEGARMLASRLEAVAVKRGVSGALPFAWRSDCPPLVNPNTADILIAMTDKAARE